MKIINNLIYAGGIIFWFFCGLFFVFGGTFNGFKVKGIVNILKELLGW